MQRPRTLGLALTSLLAALVAVASVPSAAHAGTTRIERVTYPTSSETFADPERGFYRATAAVLSPGDDAAQPLDAATLERARTEGAVTLAFRYYYLEGYQHVDTIAPDDLRRVAADLASARRAGVKVVLRFAYSESSSADAPVDRTVSHIRQIAPVLNASADVVLAVQAGFVGRWGEWYYSQHYSSDPVRPWVLSDADWDRRRQVLMALLDATSPRTRVQVRYPAIKQRLLPDPADPRAARVGIHDDCFFAAHGDAGTFATASDRAWLARESLTTVVGGETCSLSAPGDFPSAAGELAAYHWTFLNAEYHAPTLASWGEPGLVEVGQRLGHRLRLVEAVLPVTAAAGRAVTVRLTLVNDGYAPPLSDRPLQVVLQRGAATWTSVPAVRTSTWLPGTPVEVSVRVRVPPEPGEYAWSVGLPDASPSLRRDPAYSVRLANPDVWDAGTGRNDLGRSLRVTGS